jgi:hypothetical protein
MGGEERELLYVALGCGGMMLLLAILKREARRRGLPALGRGSKSRRVHRVQEGGPPGDDPKKD